MTDQLAPAFSIREALRFGWAKTKENLKPFLILGAIGLFFSLLNSALTGRDSAPGLRPLLSLVIQVLQAALTMVFIRVAIKAHDGQAFDLGHPGDLLADFFPYLLTSILYGLIVAGGFVLLIVPGVIWGLMFGYATFAVIDQKLDPIEALKESRRLTKGVKGRLLEFALLVFCVNLLGALALGVGLFVTIPLSFVAAAYVFRRLQARAAQRVEPAAPVPAIPPAAAPAPTR